MDRNCSLAARAVVIDIDPDGTLSLRPEATCAGCAGTCLWRRAGVVRVAGTKTGLPLGRGDHVEVRLPERFALAAAVVAYGLPLAGLLAGAAATGAFGNGDLAVLAGAVAGTAAALAAGAALRGRIESLLAGRCEIRRLAD